MKQDWQIKKLGEVCDKASSNVSQNKLENDNGEYPIYGASGFIKKVSFYHQPKPYLSIVKDGSGVGRITKMDAFTSVIGTLQYILPKEGIDLDYLNYSLMSVDFKKYVAGAAIPHIYFKDYQNEPFLWVPLAEQQRIVAYLNDTFGKLNQAKANIAQNLHNAKQLFESELNRIFTEKGDGWQEKKLGGICETGAGGTPLKQHKSYYENGNIPWLRSGEVCEKEIHKSELKITELGLKNSSAKMFPINTVLIAMYGATAAQVGILKFEACTNQAVCGILPNKNSIPEYIYYCFLSKKEELISKAVGNAQPNISQEKIRNTSIPIPPLATQEAIVLELDALSAHTKQLEKVYQQKLNNIEELKKRILADVFSVGASVGATLAVAQK